MSVTLKGPKKRVLSVDAEGHRTYRITYLVESDSTSDGLSQAYNCPGLPESGSSYEILDDFDVWAWCREDTTINEVVPDDKPRHWLVEKVFSTKPPDEKQTRCNDNQIEDPLLEPVKLSGDFTRFTQEETHDRFNHPIQNSSHEQIRGQNAEFDRSRPVVDIDMNVADLQIALLSTLQDYVNDGPMWGFPARCIKLSASPWERKFWGSCYYYFTRKLKFEINARQDTDASGNLVWNADGSPSIVSGWDRDILDEGDKVLGGPNAHWGVTANGETEGVWYPGQIAGADPDPTNPAHFVRAIDQKGNPTHVILDGAGKPVQVPADSLYHTSKATVAVGGSGAAGNGYIVGDVLTVVGGTNTQAATYRVTSVDAVAGLSSGKVKTVSVINQGKYTVKPANNVATTSSTGTGCTLTLTWNTPGQATNPGFIHVEKYPEANFLLLGIPPVFELLFYGR